MPSLDYLLKPKYIAVIVLSLVGFALMYIATGGNIELVFWDYQFKNLSGAEQLLAFVVGVVMLLGSAIYLFRDSQDSTNEEVTFGEPPFVRFLFHNASSSPIWLGLRLYLGFEWLSAGWHKLDSDAWRDGTALEGFWSRAVAVPTPEQAAEGARAQINYDGWRRFIQYMLDNEWYTWFNWLVIGGEILVGLGLIFGALTGIAAFFGATLNISFLLTGTVSSNPVFLMIAILIILGWRVAGYIGLDRWLIPMLGTPWQRTAGAEVRSMPINPEMSHSTSP